MDVCADAHMACGCLVPLLADGIRRRKDAVVCRSGFSNKASSRPLGLWDKSNNLTHVFHSYYVTGSDVVRQRPFNSVESVVVEDLADLLRRRNAVALLD